MRPRKRCGPGAEVVYQACFRRRRLAWARRFRRAAAGRLVRGCGYEARPSRQAVARAPAVFLLGADRAGDGPDAGALHLVLGTGMRESYRVDDFLAYYRRVRGRFLDAVRQRRRDRAVSVRALRHLRLQGACATPGGTSVTTSFAWRGSGTTRSHGSRRRDRDAGSARATAPRNRGSADGRGHVREAARSGGAPAALSAQRASTSAALEPEVGARLGTAAEALAGRLVLRHRGRPVLGAGARARVPVRRHRAADGEPVFRALWAHDRERSARSSSSSSTSSTPGCARTRSCTSTTTPPTSRPR